LGAIVPLAPAAFIVWHEPQPMAPTSGLPEMKSWAPSESPASWGGFGGEVAVCAAGAAARR
jgi:hypothetical protein